MIRMSSSQFLGGLFVVVLCLAVANVAISQVPTLNSPGKFKEHKEFVVNATPGQPDTQVYTVPTGRTFIVTDLFINNVASTTAFSQRLIRDGDASTAISITVPAENTFHHSFTQGLTFPAGSLIEARNGGVVTTIFTITGFEIKG